MHVPEAAADLDAEQAEAALLEHYPRLTRLAYLLLSPALPDGRRTRAAHALVQRVLPRTSALDGAPPPLVPHPAVAPEGTPATEAGADVLPPAGAGYAEVRVRLVRAALRTGPHRGVPGGPALPPVLPQVWGLRLAPRGGAEAELDERLSVLPPPARAAFVLRGLECLTEDETREVLQAAGVRDVDGALEAAGPDGPGESTVELLHSPAYDPCTLRARPTDLPRRRQHLKAALVAAVAALVCGALLLPPGGGWEPDGAAAPPYARNPAAQAALDPDLVVKVPPEAWQSATRRDYSVWPARGGLTGDRDLLRRALAVWARPGPRVGVSATPGTPAGAPPGPAQLLFAGDVDGARVVLFYDGLRIARYAEPAEGTGGALLDLARADGAGLAESSAVVLDRVDGNIRYLTAPWVRRAAVRDLLDPGEHPAVLHRDAAGVTEPVPGPSQNGPCHSWRVLEVTASEDRGATSAAGQRTPAAGTTLLLSDLGELTPAHLTAGRPGVPHEAAGAGALADWAGVGCSLAAMRAQGVRSVNSWRYSGQRLPETGGTAAWLCTRTETWRGAGTLAQAQFRAPGHAAGTVVGEARNSPVCGTRLPRLLAGVLWRAPSGSWYLLAAGTRDVASVTVSGAVRGSAQGPSLALHAHKGARPELAGRLANGTPVTAVTPMSPSHR
ncbi:hypothetical protein [Streptomyces sp. TS71-3]|uniref:hypothetical protein n=1 Tax=Streptomyces sp. TS71-3 TaxID=2733862 RepID=UPI001B147E61|nr:hypothetical protein [Streptomyces sp. TS71-3]GHJ38086.1 hypothetical protein Sm713_36950 [Streptomyces sp. TS71-3]